MLSCSGCKIAALGLRDVVSLVSAAVLIVYWHLTPTSFLFLFYCRLRLTAKDEGLIHSITTGSTCLPSRRAVAMKLTQR